MKTTALVISCEHGGNTVPPEYRHLFPSDLLQTHQALDIGALEIADSLNQAFACDYVKNTVTRLLIDCNRSLNHLRCFSEFTKKLPLAEKERIIKLYYLPYRRNVETIIQRHVERNHQVFHLSVHTFTPVWQGAIRNAAVSILYDSRRHAEKEVARIWQNLIVHHPPDFNVRLNYPYLGKSDGLTSSLRKQYDQSVYLGFELECNQALVNDPNLFQELKKTLSDSLNDLLQML